MSGLWTHHQHSPSTVQLHPDSLKWRLLWGYSLLLYCFASKVCSHTLYIHSAFCTIHKVSPLLSTYHFTFASLSSTDLAFYVFLTPSSHLLQVLPLPLSLSITNSYTLSFNRSQLVHSTSPNHLKTRYTLITFLFSHINSTLHFLFPPSQPSWSLQTYSIKTLISLTSSLRLSSNLMPQVSTPYGINSPLRKLKPEV